MKKIILSLFVLFCTLSVVAQYNPTAVRTQYVNGISLGTKLDGYFTSLDSNTIYWRSDSVLRAKYKGTARSIAFTDNLSAYVKYTDTASMLIPYIRTITLNTPSVIYSSPVTFTTGHDATATLSLISQSANKVFAGPTTGSAAAPSFRALVAADIPSAFLTIGNFSNTSTAKGLDFTSNVLTLHAADGTNAGAVSTTTQTFAGAKTFTSALTGTSGTFSSFLNSGTYIRAQGVGPPASGSGLEMAFSGGTSFLTSFDRTGGAYLPLTVQGSAVTLASNVSGVNINYLSGNSLITSFNAAGSVYTPLVFQALTTTFRYGSTDAGELFNSGRWYFGASPVDDGVNLVNINGAAKVQNKLTLATGTTSIIPLQFTSGTLATTPVAGGMEFLTDKFYGTISTGTARKEFTLNDAALTSGTTPVATTNGRLTDGLILAASAYTPTVTNVSNCSAFDVSALTYVRVGSVVRVSGYLGINTTSSAINSVANISIPIASTTDSVLDLGSAVAQYNISGIISGNASTVSISVKPGSTGMTYYSIQFTYTIR